MRLADAFALLGLPGAPARPAEIRRVVHDSRDVGPGDLFAALPGTRVDGHTFLAQAASQGAEAALVDARWFAEHGDGAPLPCLPVADTRQAMAKVACELAGHPSRQLALVGITGTNGKTTTAHLVRAVLSGAGAPTGVLGTLGAEFGGQRLDTGHTTPQSPDLQVLLAKMVDAGCQAVAMEASSHAIEQQRIYGCALRVAVHTNVTQDHLDYHGTMEAYTEVKTRLFNWRATGIAPAHAVINLDDPAAETFRRAAGGTPLITYGIECGPGALLWASDVQLYPAGSRFVIHWEGKLFPVALPLPGRFNVYNALAAFGTGLALGHDPDAIAAALATAPGVPGRAEVVTPPGHPFTVWVDYAHTPDGLENVLSSARALAPSRLVAVFGCGGDRDRGKRPLMGEVAGRLADMTLVTSDNPRSEEPEAIAAEVATGCGGSHRVVVDREAAIAEVIAQARPGDLIVIAGKGHETTQTFKDRVVPFDDREVARRALSGTGSAC